MFMTLKRIQEKEAGVDNLPYLGGNPVYYAIETEVGVVVMCLWENTKQTHVVRFSRVSKGETFDKDFLHSLIVTVHDPDVKEIEVDITLIEVRYHNLVVFTDRLKPNQSLNPL